MGRITGLAPIAGPDSTTLVLGSMPGEASLAAGRYYAHPRNAFWPLVYAAFGAEPETDYEARVRFAASRGIALWDVLAGCERTGSLDTAIRDPEPNDIERLLRRCPGIRRVLLNGGKAYELYIRYAAPKLAPYRLEIVKLPSTSPAHAVPFARKLEAWRIIAAP